MNELHETALIDLGKLKEQEKEAIKANFEKIKSSMVFDHTK